MKSVRTIFAILLFLLCGSIVINAEGKGVTIIALNITPEVLEPGQQATVTCYASDTTAATLKYTYKSAGGKITTSSVDGKVYYIAGKKTGSYEISVEVSNGTTKTDGSVSLEIVPQGESSPWAEVLFTVDTTTLKHVYIDAAHPAETFAPPLKIKGELTLDEGSGEAQAGGSWPTYTMYDDGSHGDKKANDGIWSIKMKFEKSDRKVHFAFDDGSDYRVGFESGITKALKDQWIYLDEFPTDNVNPAFVPDKNKEVTWDAAKVKEADKTLNETPAKAEIAGQNLVIRWDPYASFYGTTAEEYTVFMEGPFDEKQSGDIKFTTVAGKTADTTLTVPLANLAKKKNYYILVRGTYKGKIIDGKAINFSVE